MSADEGIWTGDGRVCAACELQVMDKDELDTLAKKLIGGAGSTFVLGIISVLCNPCFVTSIAAWVVGLGVLGTLLNVPRAKEALGTRQGSVWVVTILGLLFALAKLFMIAALSLLHR